MPPVTTLIPDPGVETRSNTVRIRRAGANDSGSPRFMSPTMASQAQTASGRNVSLRPRTPLQFDKPSTTKPPSKKGGKWISNAAKQVGLRVSNMTRSQSKKKATMPTTTMKSSQPVPTPTAGQKARQTTPPSLNKRLPSEKPLPSPPVVQVTTERESIQQSRSIIDAFDTPLRRAASTGPQDWPALSPERMAARGITKDVTIEVATAPASVTPMRCPQTHISAKHASANNAPEILQNDTKSMNPFASHRIPRKPVATPAPLVIVPKARTSSQNEPLAQSKSSEKASRNASLPRPTKASMLRAQMVAENLKGSNGRPVSRAGFRDENSPTKERDLMKRRNTPQGSSRHQETTPKSFSVYEDDSSQDGDVDSDSQSLNKDDLAKKSLSPKKKNHLPKGAILGSTRKHNTARLAPPPSRQPSFRTKRLSSTSPEGGPTLKIYNDAEKVIRGHGESDKENTPKSLTSKKIQNLHRATVTKEFRKSSGEAALMGKPGKKSHLERSLSSNASPTHRSRQTVPTSEREKKAKSADAALLFSLAGREELISDLRNSVFDPIVCSENLEIPTEEELSRLEKSMGVGVDEILTEKTLVQCGKYGMESRRSILSYTPSLTDSIPETVTEDYLPDFMKDHVRRYSTPISDLVTREKRDGRVNSVSSGRASTAYSHGSSQVNTRPKIDFIAANKKAVGGKIRTNEGSRPHVTTNNSLQYPPRSSSRTAVPDYTVGAETAAGLNKNAGTGPKTFKPSHIRGHSMNTASGCRSICQSKEDRPATAPLDSHKQETIETGHQFLGKRKQAVSSLRGLFRRSGEQKDGSERPDSFAEEPLFDFTSLENDILGSSSCAADSNIKIPAFFPVPEGDLSASTLLAVQIIEEARMENRLTKRAQQFLRMGQVLVNSISSSREAEKSMEEAKQAANRAELSYLMTRQSLKCVSEMIKAWNSKMDRSR